MIRVHVIDTDRVVRVGAAVVLRRPAPPRLPVHACNTRRRLFGRCDICLGVEIAPSDAEIRRRAAARAS